MGWLTLFSVQVLLIRSGNRAIHRRVGMLSAALIPVMAVLAVATVIVTKTLKYGKPDTTFPFMSVQFANVLTSSALLAAGIFARRIGGTHKRLMLIGTLVLTEPGIRRIVSSLLDGNFHEGFWYFMIETYGGTILLMLGVIAYDWRNRHRVNRSYAVAFCVCVLAQLASTWLYMSPRWAEFTSALVRT